MSFWKTEQKSAWSRFSDSFGNTDLLPVCPPVAGSPRVVGLDKRVDENRGIVACFHPITDRRWGSRGEDFQRQFLYPWQDKKG